jgi:hypothetical protein
MAWVNMDVAPSLEGGDRSFGFQYVASLAAAGNGDSILIPDDVDNVSVTVQAAGGATAEVQTTTDDIVTVQSGVGVTWVPSSLSGVTTAQAGTFHPVTAIRIVQTGAGTSKMTVRAQ